MSGYRVVRDRPPYVLIAWICMGAALLIVFLWPRPPEPDIRRLCDAQGGIVVRTLDGPVCIWAGAIIPINGG